MTAEIVARIERSETRDPHFAELILGRAKGATRGLNAGYGIDRT
jgi:hypothetical protein